MKRFWNMSAKSFDEFRREMAVANTKPESEKPEGEDLGPCASRVMPKGWVGLYVLNGKEDTHAFQYVHMGKETFAADGTSFVIEFNVPEKWRLTVRGRSLWPVFLGIHHHKIEFIKKLDRDFGGDDKTPAITGITTEPVED
jgi:hypothetical protein